MIKLTFLNGDRSVFVNLNQVRELVPGKGHTTLHYNENHDTDVKETPEQIISAWDDYILNQEFVKETMRLSASAVYANR